MSLPFRRVSLRFRGEGVRWPETCWWRGGTLPQASRLADGVAGIHVPRQQWGEPRRDVGPPRRL